MKHRILTKIFLIFIVCLYFLGISAFAETYLIPGGEVLGISMNNDHVTVAALDDRILSSKGQLQPGDEILRINGKTVKNSEDVRQSLLRSSGKIQVDVLRCGHIKTLILSPEMTVQGPKLGVYLRQGINGIGTLTFWNPDTGAFGALGHGVNDKSGELIRFTDGQVYTAQVISVKRGITGIPGQLHGNLINPIGELESNRASGVYGTMENICEKTAVPVASWNELHCGKAIIRSTVALGQPKDYTVEILKIYDDADMAGKNILLKVTDEELLALTGGIVQGMSGSPIIQDGKLIGAVTHVFTRDPTQGYGIYIGNMIDQ